MAEQAQEIAGLVDCVVRPLVEFEEDLEVTSRVLDDGTIMVEISSNEADTGKIIGRQGRVIKAIRTLARAAASRSDARVEVEILD